MKVSYKVLFAAILATAGANAFAADPTIETSGLATTNYVKSAIDNRIKFSNDSGNGITTGYDKGVITVKGAAATTSAPGVVQLVDQINDTNKNDDTTAVTPKAVNAKMEGVVTSVTNLGNGKQGKSTADFQVGNKDGDWTSISEVIVADGTNGPVKVTEQADKKLKISVDKASDRTLGLVAPGNNIDVDSDGEISVANATATKKGVAEFHQSGSGGVVKSVTVENGVVTTTNAALTADEIPTLSESKITFSADTVEGSIKNMIKNVQTTAGNAQVKSSANYQVGDSTGGWVGIDTAIEGDGGAISVSKDTTNNKAKVSVANATATKKGVAEFHQSGTGGVVKSVTVADGVVTTTNAALTADEIPTLSESKITFSADTVEGSIKYLIKDAKNAATNAGNAVTNLDVTDAQQGNADAGVVKVVAQTDGKIAVTKSTVANTEMTKGIDDSALVQLKGGSSPVWVPIVNTYTAD